ncbi:MAG: S-methyl-5-thioribose-1-phosphate isomerase [Clostridiales Family XIII bacterium]|jgi:methylthioribose-1-phosphate isomerase|nr:S-methyl-5-thioribose-1-phosphate isomerase [Clostridiales Family XIII bacterium]
MASFNSADFPTVALDEAAGEIVIIDQTLLPGEVKLLRLSKIEDIWEAINVLRVRGAPAIGVTAAFAVYLAGSAVATDDPRVFEKRFGEAAGYLATARPTAVNLFWAIGRMKRALGGALAAALSVADIKAALLKEALAIRDGDIAICKAIGEHALGLLKPGMGLLTHCNAGRLATVEYGTATSVMYLGHEKGYGFKIYCDETRPLLQGARLTAFELAAAGMRPTVICDNMVSSLMKAGKVDAVFTGCDRVAANGDSANKIGTSGVAIIAKHYGVPFYICAPSSTLDMSTPDGAGIVIEQRPAAEVTEMWYKTRMAPADADVYNPAFDVTDASLITAIVTEDGALAPGRLREKYAGGAD